MQLRLSNDLMEMHAILHTLETSLNQQYEIAREIHANEYKWMATHFDADTSCDKVLTQAEWGVERTYVYRWRSDCKKSITCN